MTTFVFKKFSHHRINGNNLEFIGIGAIQDLYQKYNDSDYFPNEEETQAHDMNGNLIWEPGDTMIDSHDCWHYYSVEAESVAELSDDEKYAYVTENHWDVIDKMKEIGFDSAASNLAKEDNKVWEFIHGSYTIEDYEEVGDDDNYELSFLDGDDWKYYKKV